MSRFGGHPACHLKKHMFNGWRKSVILTQNGADWGQSDVVMVKCTVNEEPMAILISIMGVTPLQGPILRRPGTMTTGTRRSFSSLLGISTTMTRRQKVKYGMQAGLRVHYMLVLSNFHIWRLWYRSTGNPPLSKFRNLPLRYQILRWLSLRDAFVFPPLENGTMNLSPGGTSSDTH